CIYCGGSQPADTIEHMPPVMMFIRKQRPKGLEFPSCRKCNNGTSKSDLVASLVGRLSVDPSADVEAAEITKLFSSVRNNVPGLLEEMHFDPAEEKLVCKGLPLQKGGGALRANGPLVPDICSSSVPSWALRCTTKHYRLSCRQRVVCSHCGFLTRRLREEKYRRVYFRCFQPHGRR